MAADSSEHKGSVAGVGAARDRGSRDAGAYRCPACGGALVGRPGCMACGSCEKVYPVADGVVRFIETAELAGSDASFVKMYNIFGRFYDLLARLWAAVFHGGEASFRGGALSSLEISRGYRVLETSVGTGGNLPYIGGFTCDLDIYGLDISRGMLDKCRKNLDKWGIKTRLCQANASDLPYEDNSFDSVYHLGGINGFSDREKAISEMVRAARPGAVVVISDETEKMFYSRAFKSINLKAPVELIPDGMQDLELRDAVDGTMYVLSFRKPL